MSEDRADVMRSVQTKRRVFSFSDIASLLRVCRILSCGGYAADSEAYISSDGGEFCLVVCESAGEVNIALEFSLSDTPPLSVWYLAEHYELLCPERAVQTLAALF